MAEDPTDTLSSPPIDAPWPWAVASWFGAFIGVAAVVLTVFAVWEGDRAEYEEHRALFFARAVAEATAQRDEGPAQQLIASLARQDGAVLDAYVLRDGGEDEFGIARGQAYAAALDPELRGQTLDQLRAVPLHKARADRFARATSGLADERRPGRVDPSFVLEADPESGGTVAVVPIRRGDHTFGVAGVAIAQTAGEAPVPWVGLLALLLLAGVLGTLGVRGAEGQERRLRTSLLTAITVATIIGGAVSAWAYTGAVQGLLERRVADVAQLRQAASHLDSDGAALANAADVAWTGEPGYLAASGEASAPNLAEQATARLGGGRRLAVLLAALAAFALLMGLHRHGVRFIVGARAQPHAYLYTLPSLLGMVVLVFVPFIVGVGLSAFDNDARRYYFVGIDNFIEILAGSRTGDVSFYWTLFVTVLWTLLNIVLHVGIGLGLALLLKEPALRFKRLYRVLLIVPWAVPNYITALIWKGMFNKEFGAVNRVIEIVQTALGFDPSPIDWLGGSFISAFTANLITNTWLGFPFMMVVSLGALQSIPKELYEAADVDGASRWQQFRLITLPLLKPALFPAIILGTIWTFNMFNIIYLVSGGGPNNTTEILITDAYRAFDVLGRYGFAAAYSVVIFLILLLYTLITNRISKATEGAVE